VEKKNLLNCAAQIAKGNTQSTTRAVVSNLKVYHFIKKQRKGKKKRFNQISHILKILVLEYMKGNRVLWHI
jgi:hypothetical protein